MAAGHVIELKIMHGKAPCKCNSKEVFHSGKVKTHS